MCMDRTGCAKTYPELISKLLPWVLDSCLKVCPGGLPRRFAPEDFALGSLPPEVFLQRFAHRTFAHRGLSLEVCPGGLPRRFAWSSRGLPRGLPRGLSRGLPRVLPRGFAIGTKEN